MSDILTAISILLIFLTVLLTFISTEINSTLKKLKPERARGIERKNFIRDLRIILFFKSIPITLTFTFVTYILLPKTVQIIREGEFSIWDFNLLNTMFLMIELGLMAFVVYSFIQVGRIIFKLYQ